MNFKTIRHKSISFNRIVADKSHRVTLASFDGENTATNCSVVAVFVSADLRKNNLAVWITKDQLDIDNKHQIQKGITNKTKQSWQNVDFQAEMR